jgi:hypothetical protein
MVRRWLGRPDEASQAQATRRLRFLMGPMEMVWIGGVFWDFLMGSVAGRAVYWRSDLANLWVVGAVGRL